ncbi:hypothetical protein LTR70_004052 [Exophiala xenobiotica]|uniref:ABC transporter domain-containing protein n=1 Tax=Lithohypha guttulata TaxID=1690604 RepID=A0ABR0KEN1_9EURO|nr:hypothetical protein LTR24_003504 [Lithohypha guttulata]KAK5321662.1 hypothetical protein LTR70_004052 [Exophiala xenobiotica]
MHATARALAKQPNRLTLSRDIVNINKGTFYKEYPSRTGVATSNPPILKDLSFHLQATQRKDVGEPVKKFPHWAVIGTNPTSFLNVLKGDYICDPPNARTYPYLSSNEIRKRDPQLAIPSRAIQYVGFNSTSGGGLTASGGVQGAYLSARYESRREETDWTVSQYLRGQTELNPSEELAATVQDDGLFSRVVKDLRLGKLLDMPVSNLSNGQTRRSRIAKALLNRPEILLLDEPFMGLDPPTLVTLSPILKEMAIRSSPIVMLGLRLQDPIPDWITHLVILGKDNTVAIVLQKEMALYTLYCWARAERDPNVSDDDKKMAAAFTKAFGPPPFELASFLTSDGIQPYIAVEEAYQMMKVRSTNEKLGPPAQKTSHLNGVARRRYQQARDIPEGERTPLQWMNMTALLNSHLFRRLRNDAIKPAAPPTDTVPSMTPPKSTTATPQPKSKTEKSKSTTPGAPLIELNNITVKYGDKTVLGYPPPQPGHESPGLNLTISRGSRLLLLGPNGSGKTTLLSLLTSDHPQSYSLPIKFFGRTRLPSPGKPGLSLWEIQSRIGHSSPEVHGFFPRGLTVQRVLESAWAETWQSKPEMSAEKSRMVEHFLRVWGSELCQTPSTAGDNSLGWASDKENHPAFGRLPFGTQRLLLLLRAIIKQPDIIILDEAFSGLPTAARDKALRWLEQGDTSLTEKVSDGVTFPGLLDRQALVVVSHVREEVPGCINEYVRLPSEEEAMEMQKTIVVGRSEHGYIKSFDGWNRVWGL